MSARAQGPLSEFYLVSKNEGGGGRNQIDVVQGTNVVRGWSTKRGSELALAVNDTVRTLGILSVPAPGDLGAEYTLAGAYTGTDYPFPLGSTNFLQFLDGTSDGLHNFAWDFNNNDAWQFDSGWANGTRLFHLSDTVSRAGIAYDGSDNSLWLSAYNSNLIEHRARDGTLIWSFPVPHIHNVALGLDAADNTLWFLSSDLPGWLVQYSRAGHVLSTQFYATLAVKNILGGEFHVPPRPARLSLLGADPNGRSQLLLEGLTPGKTNILQSSLDLSSWISVATNVATSTSLIIVDPVSENSDQRFYRSFEIH